MQHDNLKNIVVFHAQTEQDEVRHDIIADQLQKRQQKSAGHHFLLTAHIQTFPVKINHLFENCAGQRVKPFSADKFFDDGHDRADNPVGQRVIVHQHQNADYHNDVDCKPEQHQIRQFFQIIGQHTEAE